MADDDVPGDVERHAAGDEEDLASEEGRVTAQGRPTAVAEVSVGGPPAVQWRKRALAVRDAVPQLDHNPVVVGASAAVATAAVRLVVDVAHRAVGASAPSRPRTGAVTGSILHEVHVVRHVHVIHHYPDGPLPYSSRWSPRRVCSGARTRSGASCPQDVGGDATAAH